MSADTIVGVDLGATLAKIVTLGDLDSGIVLPSNDVEAVRAAVAERAPAIVGVTGGGGGRFGSAIEGARLRRVGEFEAWASGVGRVAAATGIALPAIHLVACVGTGTSVLRVDGYSVERVGGTAVGGGTLMGLGRLLTPARRFEDLVALAALGDRATVDLLVGEVYPDGDAPEVLRALTAANFAKLGSEHPADLAHAIVGLVGETVALMTGALARAAGTDTVVYCGSTLVNNRPLVDIVQAVTTHFGQHVHVLAHPALAGAWGAAILANAEPV